MNFQNKHKSIMIRKSEENYSELKSTNGTWQVNCDEGSGSLNINDEDVFIEVNSNQIYIDALIKKQNDSIYNLYLKSPNDLGAGGMRLNWDGFSKDSIIASFNYNQKSNSLKFDWYGFYDISIQKRIWKEDSDFQIMTEKTGNIKLIKCK